MQPLFHDNIFSWDVPSRLIKNSTEVFGILRIKRQAS